MYICNKGARVRPKGPEGRRKSGTMYRIGAHNIRLFKNKKKILTYLTTTADYEFS